MARELTLLLDAARASATLHGLPVASRASDRLGEPPVPHYVTLNYMDVTDGAREMLAHTHGDGTVALDDTILARFNQEA